MLPWFPKSYLFSFFSFFAHLGGSISPVVRHKRERVGDDGSKGRPKKKSSPINATKGRATAVIPPGSTTAAPLIDIYNAGVELLRFSEGFPRQGDAKSPDNMTSCAVTSAPRNSSPPGKEAPFKLPALAKMVLPFSSSESAQPACGIPPMQQPQQQPLQPGPYYFPYPMMDGRPPMFPTYYVPVTFPYGGLQHQASSTGAHQFPQGAPFQFPQGAPFQVPYQMIPQMTPLPPFASFPPTSVPAPAPVSGFVLAPQPHTGQ